MALTIYSSSPARLLAAIRDKSRKNDLGYWHCDEEGDFTDDDRRAWLRPVVSINAIQFGLLGKKDEKMSTVTYAQYHGRFLSVLLIHFDKDFVSATVTADKDSAFDRV